MDSQVSYTMDAEMIPGQDALRVGLDKPASRQIIISCDVCPMPNWAIYLNLNKYRLLMLVGILSCVWECVAAPAIESFLTART